VVRASPEGEMSGGHAASSRSAQDAETSTVDRSREGPSPDTAPGPDQAATHPDPIWGGDAPDAVSWHAGTASGSDDPRQAGDQEAAKGGSRHQLPGVPAASPPPAGDTPVAEQAAAAEAAGVEFGADDRRSGVDAGWFSISSDPERPEDPAAAPRPERPDPESTAGSRAPGPDPVPRVGRGEAGGVVESEPDAEPDAGPDAGPVPWLEPALPIAWPPGAEAPAGGVEASARGSDEPAEPELPPAPDPRWPRLFSPGVQASVAVPEGRGDLPPEQDAAGNPAPGPDSYEPGRHEAAPWPPPSSPEPGAAEGIAGKAGQVGRAPPGVEATASANAPAEAPDTGGAATATDGADGPAGPGGTPTAAAGDRPSPAVNADAGTGMAAQIGQTETRPATSASSVPAREHANMAPAGQSIDPSVSRETGGGGGAVNQQSEDRPVEDEAAIAVREAVSRAAAQAGVDVSRETSTDALAPGTEATFPPGAVVEALGDTPRVDIESAARSARVTFRIHGDGVNGYGRILAVANQKGGVGKSTTAVNLGAYLALAGARVLVVDLDPQGNASTGLGLDHREIEPSIYDVLTGEAPPATAIRATTVSNLHVLPSTIDLAGAEVELVSVMSREARLGRALESIHHHYDTVLIDCPPSLGLLTVNALAAADELLIPIQCEYYALEGLGQLLRNVELVRANLNPELRIGGIVLTMYDGRTRLAEQVVAEVRKHFSDLVYQTVVPRSVRLSEAPGYGLPIALYDPLSRGGIAYRDLAFELAERSGLLAPTGEGAS